MTSRKLIINADDLGFNHEVTDGIFESHRSGVVTSTTLMVNMPAADYAMERIHEFPNLSVGIHLNLTTGAPLTDPKDVPSLVDENGQFHHYRKFTQLANRWKLSRSDLEREMIAQFQKFESYGVVPTHADSHHHSTYCLQVFPILLKLLSRFKLQRMRSHRGWFHRDRSATGDLKLRWKTLLTNIRRFPQRIYYEVQHRICKSRGFKVPDERYDFYKVVGNQKMGFRSECVPNLLATMPPGTIEMVCHPGYLSEDPTDTAEFRQQRREELDLMTSSSFADALNSSGIELINFTQF